MPKRALAFYVPNPNQNWNRRRTKIHSGIIRQSQQTKELTDAKQLFGLGRAGLHGLLRGHDSADALKN